VAYDRATVARLLRDGRVLGRTTVAPKEGATRYVFVAGDALVEAQLHQSGRLRELRRAPLSSVDRWVEFHAPFLTDDEWFVPAPPPSLPPLIAERDAWDARVEAALADGTAWLPRVHAHSHYRRSAIVGLERVTLDGHEPSGRSICLEQALSPNVDDEFFTHPERLPEPIAAETLATLRKGERVYAETLEALRTGAIGWRIHVDLLVVHVDGDWYNTGFSGDAAIALTRFNPIGASNLADEILTKATTGQAAACIHAVTPAQLGTLRARIGTPDTILEELAAGDIELLGGGPTSDLVWSLTKVGERYVQRGAGGEHERTAADVARMVRGRHYHSTRRR